jgi:hypothetical protein
VLTLSSVTRPVQTVASKRENAQSETQTINAECAELAISPVSSSLVQSESSQCQFIILAGVATDAELTFSTSQRKYLLEQLRKKDAIIESFRQMLKPHMLHLHSGSDHNPSSGSPPSSAAHEEPLRKQVLEWLEKADASKVSSSSFNLDSRAFNESSSDDNEGPADRFSSAASSLSHPLLQQQHSHGYSISSGVSGNYIDLARNRSRSPRVTRKSAIAIHPVGLLARASLFGSGMGSRPSSIGEPINSPTSPGEIGVARHDYFVSSDSMAQRASQLGLRRIEIDRGLSEEPKLLRKGLIVPDEVDKLFEIFYAKLNVSSSSHSGVPMLIFS